MLTSSLIRQAIVPMAAGYILVMATLALAIRYRPRPSPGPGRHSPRGQEAQPGQEPASGQEDAPPQPGTAPQQAAPPQPGTPAQQATMPQQATPPPQAGRPLFPPTARMRAGPLARHGRGWLALLRHWAGTAAGGYLLLMTVVIVYYYGIARVAGDFIVSAFRGTAILVGLATAAFAAASWLTTRRHGHHASAADPASHRQQESGRTDRERGS